MIQIVKFPIIVFFVFFSIVSSRSSQKEMNSETTDSMSSYSKNYIELFNGENLNGWYTFLKNRGQNNDPNKVFTVHNGIIRISGEEWGCITTEREYENYHLVAVYKWGRKTFKPREDKARDCGILLHSTGKDGAYAVTWMHSIECQLIEGGTGDVLVVGDC